MSFGSIAQSEALSNRRGDAISLCHAHDRKSLKTHAHRVGSSFPCVGSSGEKYMLRKCSRNYYSCLIRIVCGEES